MPPTLPFFLYAFCHGRPSDNCFSYFFTSRLSLMACFFLLDKQRYLGYCLYLIQVKHPWISYASGRHWGLLTTVFYVVTPRGSWAYLLAHRGNESSQTTLWLNTKCEQQKNKKHKVTSGTWKPLEKSGWHYICLTEQIPLQTLGSFCVRCPKTERQRIKCAHRQVILDVSFLRNI